jgi:light-regulated signal transduction histidine kinase (bacteriophytochrome)
LADKVKHRYGYISILFSEVTYTSKILPDFCSDNGMGLEQKYAESIFGLFYRLHKNDEFPGSGIGLSICKKIAENHNGYILAEGEPDKVSTFSLFLHV